MKKILFPTIIILISLTSCARNLYERYITINCDPIITSNDKEYHPVDYIKGAVQGYLKAKIGQANRTYSLPLSSEDETIADGYDLYFSFKNTSIKNMAVSSFKSENGSPLIMVNKNTIRIEKILKDDTITITPERAYEIVFNLGSKSGGSTAEADEGTDKIDKIEFVLNPDETDDARRYGLGFYQTFDKNSSNTKTCNFIQAVSKTLTFRLTPSQGYGVKEIRCEFESGDDAVLIEAEDVDAAEKDKTYVIPLTSTSGSQTKRTVTIVTARIS